MRRETVLYYVEYGLWEMEHGDVSSSIKTLSTVMASRGAVLDQADDTAKADLCALYRALAEVQVSHLGRYIFRREADLH